MASMVEVINGIADSWMEVMWAALWQSSLLAGAILIVGVLFKRISPATRYWLWMFVGLRLLVMPFVSLELMVLPAPVASLDAPAAGTNTFEPGALQAPSLPEGTGEVPGQWRVDATQPPSGASPESTPAPIPLSPAGTLLVLWGAGLTFVLARLVWKCWRTSGLIASADLGDARVNALADRVGGRFGMKRRPRVGTTRAPIAPFVFGVLNPTVLLPRTLVEQASDEQLLMVLAHEFAHVRRRDPLLGWGFALCHAVYFFHPLLPFVRRQLLLERERACDDWVLSLSQVRPSVYARLLVAVASMCSTPRQPLPALVTGETFHDLKTRLHGLRQGTVRRAHLSPVSAAALALLALIAAPGVVLLPGRSNAAPAHPGSPAGSIVQAAVSDPGSVTVETAAEASAAEDTTVEPAMRTITFPERQAVGTLMVKDRSIPHYIDRYWCWNDDIEWASMGAAQGVVRVPENRLVWLQMNDAGAADPSFMRRLRPDDLYRLSAPYSPTNQAPLDDRGMESVVTLTGLRNIELRNCQVTDRGLALLQGLPHLERLTVPSRTTDRGLAHVAAIQTLRGLYIHQNQAGDAGVAHLASLTNLRELILGSGHFTDAGLSVLSGLPKLEYLMLWGTAFGDAGMVHVARIPNLTTLNVSHLPLTNRGVEYIAQSPKLETLSLYGVMGITGPALKDLAEMKTLRRLDLGCPPGQKTRINGTSMVFLAKSTSLEALDAPRALDDSGLVHLAKLPRLRELNCGNGSNDPNITDTGAFAVSSMKSLRKLGFFGGGLTDAGLTAIGGLRDLESLSLYTESKVISNGGVQELAQLTQLQDLTLGFNDRSGVTVSALTALNSLTSLRELRVIGFVQDDSVLDLSPMRELRSVGLHFEGGVRDDDLACFAGMTQLQKLHGLLGVSDAGVAHIAGLKQLKELTIKGDGITDATLAALQGFTELRSLYLEGRFSDSGIQALGALRGLDRLELTSKSPLGRDAEQRLVASLPALTYYNYGVGFGAGGG
jgi:internalin A